MPDACRYCRRQKVHVLVRSGLCYRCYKYLARHDELPPVQLLRGREDLGWQVAVRMPAAERKRIEALAQASDLSLAAWIRSLVLRELNRPRSKPK